MKQKILLHIKDAMLFAFLVFVTSLANAQTTNCTNHINNSSSNSILFNVQNTNNGAILVTDISSVLSGGNGGAATFTLLYNPTPINSLGATWSQGSVGVGVNGWVQGGSATITLPSTTTPQTVISGMSIVIPPGATYGFALCAGSNSLGFMTLTSPGVNTFSSGGVNVLTGDNISWSCGDFTTGPLTPLNYQQGFDGCITWVAYPACSTTPTPGTAVTSNASPCTNQSVDLSLIGSSIASGITYQWEDSISTGTTWSPVSGATSAISTITPSGAGAHYYRCDVTCSGNTAYSTPVLVAVPFPFPAGTYFIDGTSPTGGNTFHSVSDAISAISCGIAGPITFVMIGPTTSYNEQVTLPASIGATATNTVTFYCNGDTITYDATNAAQPWTLGLNGADHISFFSLNVVGQNANYAYACHL